MFECGVIPSSCKLVGILGNVGAGVILLVSLVSLLSGVGCESGRVVVIGSTPSSFVATLIGVVSCGGPSGQIWRSFYHTGHT